MKVSDGGGGDAGEYRGAAPHSRPSLTVDSLNRRTNTTRDNSMQSRSSLPIPVRRTGELNVLTDAHIVDLLVCERRGYYSDT